MATCLNCSETPAECICESPRFAYPYRPPELLPGIEYDDCTQHDHRDQVSSITCRVREAMESQGMSAGLANQVACRLVVNRDRPLFVVCRGRDSTHDRAAPDVAIPPPPAFPNDHSPDFAPSVDAQYCDLSKDPEQLVVEGSWERWAITQATRLNSDKAFALMMLRRYCELHYQGLEALRVEWGGRDVHAIPYLS